MVLCQNCGTKPANFFYQEAHNGSKIELHLCADCAKKLGVDKYQPNLLSSFSMFTTSTEPKKAAACPLCGTTMKEIRDRGKFGCSACYDTFQNKLDMTPYVGKGYKHKKQATTKAKTTRPRQKSIEALRAELKKAVAEENYERAAELRDEIRAREGK